ncbi:uncharacterized protein [Linepithema humile]|uniref:uncharacterized protein n=1 Tax=Linepithema humile TaxID=83485 RepID=UPI0006236EAA|nr:PREDICTED: uncharacterized protein LOC105674853 [Linepithema humile]
MLQPRVLTIVYLLIVIAHLCSCVHQATYNKYTLEEEKICHILNKKHTHSMRNGTAVIVTSHNMLERWIVRGDRNCIFVFKPAKNEGLLAVIHKMFFRRNGSDNCLDYVQFKRSDGHSTKKICGEIDRSKSTDSPVSDQDDVIRDLSDNLYDSFAEFESVSKPVPWFPLIRSSELETEIVISKERVPSGQSLDLSIIYTPYRSCINADRDYKHVGNSICIRKEYVCDRIYNCPTGLCFDEDDCTYTTTDQYPKDDTATKVTIGAVTTMILCFIVFVMCLWICKKSRKLCWSSDCAGPNACSRPDSLSQDADGGSGSNRAVPTAPMLEVVVTSPVADKDLPPSYDSLFPEQSNPARS